jgi:ribonuclease P protein component
MSIPVRTLRRRAEFLRLKESGQRVNTQAFVLQWLSAPEEPGVALGFTCSKALGGAVQRNRARRRLKAGVDVALRLNLHAQGGGKVLVFIGKMPIFNIKYKHLLKDIHSALEQAGLQCQPTI